MLLLRHAILLPFLLFFTSLIAEEIYLPSADDSTEEILVPTIEEEVVDQRDSEALKDWLNTKRQVTIKERGGSLSLSGEVRAELQCTNENKNGRRQRGRGGEVKGMPILGYDVEVNVMLDYRSDLTWAAIKLEFDNNAGIFFGTFDKVILEKAYFGARVINGDTYTADIEVGRRRLGDVFDSKIEFGSFMDGVHVKYDQAFDFFGDFYLHCGPFLINERRSQYGFVGEFGILNLFNTGLYTKYSLIDWDTKHFSSSLKNRIFRFLVSQVILGYKFLPCRLNKMVTCYAAGLLNHRATSKPITIKDPHGVVVKKVRLTGGMEAAWAAYFGFSVGEVRKPGDWSLDVNYQLVAAQSIPSFDASGIGRGNAAKIGFFTRGSDEEINTRREAVGGTNYKGLSVDFLYMITNNLTMIQSWRQSVTLHKSIGPRIRYKQYEIEFVYAF